MAKVTIEDISRQTGLSRGTVSRALNNRPDISQATKARVLEACRKLNYVPSQAARSLATGRNYSVSVLLDEQTDHAARSFLSGIMATADLSNYSVTVLHLPTSDDARHARLERLAHERVDAVLNTVPMDYPSASRLRESLGSRPIATIAPIDGVASDQWEIDYAESGRLVARYAIGLGRPILYVDGSSDRGAQARREGFIDALRHAEFSDPERHVLTVSAGSAPQQVAEQIKPRIAEVSVLVGSDDEIAASTAFAVASLGCAVPADVEVVGQGNNPTVRRVLPWLTTTDYTGGETGRRAMELVLQRLNKDRLDEPGRVVVTPRLVSPSSAN